ncbi:MAG: cob(I)yrinic acid a,c-diamide adenosyltransferase [Proteobacteria bacterium]|nr:cob(I)yrinic acid a,c-diamide adenosyltransferase [Pseudomonadota bacterium]
MVKLNRIYTRTGDGGDTGLATGERVLKDDARVAAYGEVDETNACLGLARLQAAGDAWLDAALGRIQNELFDLGADLATPERDEPLGFEPLRVTPDQVARLEREIDFMNEAVSPLNSFVLPGGSPLASALHLARTVSRRAERASVTLSRMPGERVSPTAIAYLNRLSDHLFVASRRANADGAADVLWVPGATRDQG